MHIKQKLSRFLSEMVFASSLGLKKSVIIYSCLLYTSTPYDSLCVSNQFEEDEVKITFGSVIVILMETRDKK